MKVDSVFTANSNNFKLKYGMGYQGHYSDKSGMLHTIYLAHIIHETKAIQIIMDTTDSTFDLLKREFQLLMKSIRIKS